MECGVTVCRYPVDTVWFVTHGVIDSSIDRFHHWIVSLVLLAYNLDCASCVVRMSYEENTYILLRKCIRLQSCVVFAVVIMFVVDAPAPAQLSIARLHSTREFINGFCRFSYTNKIRVR